MKKVLVVIAALACLALPSDFADARGGGRGGMSSGSRGGRSRGKRRNRDAKVDRERRAEENRDGLLRDAGRDAV